MGDLRDDLYEWRRMLDFEVGIDKLDWIWFSDGEENTRLLAMDKCML
jgi:hypothetical protein